MSRARTDVLMARDLDTRSYELRAIPAGHRHRGGRAVAVPMTGRVPVWRSPQIAPAYALVLAFAAVAVASWLFGIFAEPTRDNGLAPQTDTGAAPVTVRVSGDALPKDLRIAVGGATDGAVVDTGGTAKVASGAVKLCLLSEEPVRVADVEPPTDCVSGTTTAIRVEHVVVHVMSGDEPARGGVVTVDGENVRIDDDGRYLPKHSLVGQPVCITPPVGSTVAEPPAGPDRKSCTTPKNRLVDVVFKVENQ
jgi:hypothetical protein